MGCYYWRNLVRILPNNRHRQLPWIPSTHARHTHTTQTHRHGCQGIHSQSHIAASEQENLGIDYVMFCIVIDLAWWWKIIRKAANEIHIYKHTFAMQTERRQKRFWIVRRAVPHTVPCSVVISFRSSRFFSTPIRLYLHVLMWIGVWFYWRYYHKYTHRQERASENHTIEKMAFTAIVAVYLSTISPEIERGMKPNKKAVNLNDNVKIHRLVQCRFSKIGRFFFFLAGK